MSDPVHPPRGVAALRAHPLFAAVRPFAPRASACALLHFAGYLGPPLAVQTLGTATPWLAPLALGVALGALRTPVERAVRARLKPALFRTAAALALESDVPVAEAESGNIFFAVFLVERAVVSVGPAALGAGGALGVIAGLLARAWGPAALIPLSVTGLAAVALYALRGRTLGALYDATAAARDRLSARIAAAARDTGEIRAGTVRARFLDATSAAAADVVHAEVRLEVRARRQRWLALGLAAVVSAALLWLARAGMPADAVLALRGAAPASALRGVALLLTALAPALALASTVEELGHAREQARALSALRAVAAPRPAPVPFPPGAHPVRIAGASFAYGARPALGALTAEIPARGVTAIAGPNGAGKSTLARLVAGVTQPSGGEITLGDVPLRVIDPDAIAFVPQAPVLLESMTVAENARLVVPDASDDAIARALAALGLALRPDHPTQALSRGEQRRIAIARALLKRPRLLVLDEPDAGLDVAGRATLVAALRGYAREAAVVVVTHRAELLRDAARVLLLGADHALVAAGSPAELTRTTPAFRALLDAADAPLAAAPE